MRILITGATGTLGTELIKLMPKIGFKHQVFGLTRSDHNFQKLIKANCTPILGDIRDKSRIFQITKKMDIVFHLAALKHVDIMEANLTECIKTNVDGTRNIIQAQEHWGIKKVIFTSTDKAVLPVNAYGASKLLAEKFTLHNSNNVVCRYGNVINSTGSFFKRLPDIFRENRFVSITDSQATRFWIKKEDAALFVLSCINKKGLQIPEMKGASVIELVHCKARLEGLDKYELRESELRPGEKVHETLDGIRYSNEVEQYTTKEMEQLLL